MSPESFVLTFGTHYIQTLVGTIYVFLVSDGFQDVCAMTLILLRYARAYARFFLSGASHVVAILDDDNRRHV